MSLIGRAAGRLWVGVLFFASTLVFWGLLQSQVGPVEPDYRPDAFPLEHHHPEVRIPSTTPVPTKPAPPQFKVVPGGTSPKLRPPPNVKLYPTLGEREDRILSQVNLIPGYSDYNKPANTKLILLDGSLPDGVPPGDKKFQIDGCPVRNCHLTDDRKRHEDAHAIVYDGGMFHEPFPVRPPGQLSIIYLLESPENVADLKGHVDRYNWTATYRLDSTINTPYERFISYANVTELPPPSRNYAEGKTKKVAWFVSNCYATNKRGAYASELQKYIDVDVYGACGNKTCFRSDKARCNQVLNTDYKFYLAFENSNCRDYITEKFYWNALYNDVIPVVMGARPQDYAAISPPGSYIHVDDFESPEHLAAYLHKLDANDTLYNEYFRWKGTGEFIDTKYWCRLCSMVHEAYSGASTTTSWYSDIGRWWNGPGVCIRPGPGEKWASWREHDSTISDDTVISDTLKFGSR